MKVSVVLMIIPILILFNLGISGGNYKNYQDRSLSTAIEMNTDLSEEEIEYLVSLPRSPELVPTPSVI